MLLLAIYIIIGLAVFAPIWLPRLLPKNFLTTNGWQYALWTLPVVAVIIMAIASILTDIGAEAGLFSLYGLFSSVTSLYLFLGVPIVYGSAIIIGAIQVLIINYIKKHS